MDTRQVGHFIRHRRQAMGLTQRELADSLHVTDTAVSKWERGLSLPDTAILIPLAGALGVTEGELLRGGALRPAQGEAPQGVRKALLHWMRDVFAWSPPWGLLGRVAPVWLMALLLVEPIDLLLQRAYEAQGGGVSYIIFPNPYGATSLTLFALPSLAAGLWLSRAVHRRRPFPALGGNPLLVWLRHCLPGLAIAFVLWWVVFCGGQSVTIPLDLKLSRLIGDQAAGWTAWANLPYRILRNFLLGAYPFRAVVFYFFYGLGVCRYLARPTFSNKKK